MVLSKCPLVFLDNEHYELMQLELLCLAAVPIGEYAAVALLIWFGLRAIKNAYYLPSEPVASQGDQGELAEAEQFLKKSEVGYCAGCRRVLAF